MTNNWIPAPDFQLEGGGVVTVNGATIDGFYKKVESTGLWHVNSTISRPDILVSPLNFNKTNVSDETSALLLANAWVDGFKAMAAAWPPPPPSP